LEYPCFKDKECTSLLVDLGLTKFKLTNQLEETGQNILELIIKDLCIRKIKLKMYLN